MNQSFMNKIINDIEKRTYILEKNLKLKSVTKVQRWKTKSISSKAPTDSMIRHLVEKFKDTGSAKIDQSSPRKFPQA